MNDFLIYGGGLAVLALLGWIVLQAGKTGAARPPVDPAALQGLEDKARSLELRGAIMAVIESDSLEGMELTPLGEVSVTREAGHDASSALARAAAARYAGARVVIGMRQRTTAKGVEWRGTACGARPRDYRLLPVKAKGAVPVLVDGSNVVNWERNAGLADKARLGPLRGVCQVLRGEGRQVHVICDASVGHVLAGRFMNSGALWQALGKPKGVQVTVIDKGQIADQALIDTALKTGAEIVTNDLYRDHPAAAFLRYRRGWSGHGHVGLLPLREVD